MPYREKCPSCTEKDEKIAQLEEQLSRVPLWDRFLGWAARMVWNEPVRRPALQTPADETAPPAHPDRTMWLDAAEKHFFIQYKGCTYVREYDRTAPQWWYVDDGWTNMTHECPAEPGDTTDRLARMMVAYGKVHETQLLLERIKAASLDTDAYKPEEG